MNTRIFLVIGLLLVVILGVVLYQQYSTQTPQEEALTEVTISRPESGIGFTYKIGVDGYSLAETERPASSTDVLRSGFVLTPTQTDDSRTTTAAQPVISIFVLEKPDTEDATSSVATTTKPSEIEKLQKLANEYKNLTAIDAISGEPELVTLDGVDALYYTTNGVYTTDTYVASAFGNIYLIIGQYNDVGDKIHQDFVELVSSISFI